MNPFKRLGKIASPHIKYFAGGLVATIIVSLLDLYLAEALRQFTMMLTGKPELLNRVCLILIGVYLGKFLFGYLQAVLLSAGVFRLSRDLRSRLYNHLLSLSLGYFDRNRTGQLISRMTNDINLIQSSSPLFIEMVSAPLRGIGAIVLMFILNWRLTLVAMLIVPLMAFVITRVAGKVRGLTRALQARLADITDIMQETISGVRIIKSFAAEDYEISRFSDQNRESYRAAMRGARRSAILTPLVDLIATIGIVGILLYGGYQVAKGTFPIETLPPFILLMMQAANAARAIGRLNVNYQAISAASERIFEVLDSYPEILEPADAVAPGKLQGQVTFDDIHFSYAEDKEVLSGVSFDIEPGQIVALVGPSGAGKSTIANLIPRFYDPDSGVVLVDNTDVKQLKLTPLRRQIGIVPQDTMLFAASIRENIAYGRRDATIEEVEAAARSANAHDFIVNTPMGYDTVLGERGARLSQGQRQRIAIARAILADPAILVLDEATSSLDAESERLVQDALEKLMRGRTTLVIAHRLVTITKADRIIVLEGGKVVEDGSFAQLMTSDSLFRRLYETQHRQAEAIAHAN